MASLFSPDSKPYRFMSRFTDIVTLSLLWILCSLPVVTLGISTIALFTVTLKMTDDKEGHVSHDFFNAFKANWKQGIPMSFITVIAVSAVYLDFWIYSNMDPSDSSRLMILIFGIVAAYVLGFALLYVYPLLARYENSVLKSLKNSFSISMRYFVRSLFLAIIVAFLFAVIFWNTKTLLVGVLMGPGFIAFTVSAFSMIIFKKIELIPGSTSNDPSELDEDEFLNQ